MRIIAMADSHGASSVVMNIVKKNIYTADTFIHLGDGENDTHSVLQEYPQIKMYRVRGNCDRGNDIPAVQIIETVQGPDDKIVRVIAVHGHMHNTAQLLRLAKENGCTIALFGHTHRRFYSSEDGVLMINPGSCAQPRDDNPPSYAYIDITSWGVIAGIVDLIE